MFLQSLFSVAEQGSRCRYLRVEHVADALPGSVQQQSSDEKAQQHHVGEDGGKIHHLGREGERSG